MDFNHDVKIIRDLVFGYIPLTELDLAIIDTPGFQRLKDIRQLTSQLVYATARHTRFEHSLGVMYLTRQAMDSLSKNGYLTKEEKFEFSENTQLSAYIAALLHDVGHCPLSHLGERQFDKTKLVDSLAQLMKERGIANTDEDELQKKWKWDISNHGAAHEILSCIVILKTYYKRFEDLGINEQVDYEMIIRCILGIPYVEDFDNAENASKNIVISLINSSALDMDKLDYIMRDSLYTGISVPSIDIKRLFRSMYISDHNTVVFKSPAIPVLQNIIETRDNLYLWVYNHHTTIYTDFLYYYIFRRLSKNYAKFASVDPGIVNPQTLFSETAVVEELVSDSDVIHMINQQYRMLKKEGYPKESDKNLEDIEKAKLRVFRLLEQLMHRSFLKPWWKTIFEYKNFMNANFLDDNIRSELAKRICAKENLNAMSQETADNGIYGDEFRSQITKCVVALSQKHHRTDKKVFLDDGDFFLVQRSNKFYSLKHIEEIMVYLKVNEVIIAPKGEVAEGDYYGKKINNLLPQKDFNSEYQPEGFYLYVMPFENKKSPGKGSENDENYNKEKREYYDDVADIFVHVARSFAKMSPPEFARFCRTHKDGELKKEITPEEFGLQWTAE